MKRKLMVVVCSVLLLALLVSCSKESKNDIISGGNWEANDGSLLELNDDGTFKWYQDPDDKTDNYYSGTYRVYNGQAAIENIAKEFAEYSVTEKEQLDMIDRNKDWSKDIYYNFILHNEECIVDGENVLNPDAKTTPYFGFYYEDEKYLDLANMRTANYVGFTKIEK